MHDIGKGIEPYNHVEAGLQALEDLISERTHFLIANHMHAHDVRNGTIRGKGESRELQGHVAGLRGLDAAQRVRQRRPRAGAVVGTVDEAIDYLRELERQNEGEE